MSLLGKTIKMADHAAIVDELNQKIAAASVAGEDGEESRLITADEYLQACDDLATATGKIEDLESQNSDLSTANDDLNKQIEDLQAELKELKAQPAGTQNPRRKEGDDLGTNASMDAVLDSLPHNQKADQFGFGG